MDYLIDTFSRYFNKLAIETGQVARELDGMGWAIVSAILLVCGWFFLRNNNIGTH